MNTPDKKPTPAETLAGIGLISFGCLGLVVSMILLIVTVAIFASLF